MNFKDFIVKKSVGVYLCAVMVVLTLLAEILYLARISDQMNAAVAIMLPLSLLIYIIIMIKPIKYLEYAAFAFSLVAMIVYIATEADYISVCMYGIDAIFSGAYLFQIGLMVCIGLLGIIPPIFKIEESI